jgi:ribosomal protein L11 methyltransferase
VIRLAVRASAEAAEPVLAALLELAPAGLEQEDGAGWVEYALYGEPAELPLAPGEHLLGGARVSVRAKEVAADWADRWRSFHSPVLVGGRVWVRPPWEPPHADLSVLDVAIDPGRAFGTGAHATTRGCLELLLGLEPRGPLADLGCGSGVLAIAAARLGFDPVTAWDSDPAAVEAAEHNARRNGVDLAGVERRDLLAGPLPQDRVLVANLTGPLLRALAPALRRSEPRALVLSGMLERESGAVASALRPLRERRRLAAEGWVALEIAPVPSRGEEPGSVLKETP